MTSTDGYDDEFQFVAAREMQARPIEWLVAGVFESCTVASLFGPPGVAKTFYALDVACCVASGLQFHEREVLAGSVYYVLGEGFNGIIRRTEAWAKHNKTPRPEHLYFSNKASDLFYSGGARKVVEEIETISATTGTTPRLIVVDTLARNFSGEENSAKDIGQFIQNIDDIRFRWGATVLVVHHTGKDLDRGARGSTALRSAVDAEYEVARGGNAEIRVTCKKMKDGAPPQLQGYQLVDIEAINHEGEVIQSAVLQRVDISEQVREPSGKNQKIVLDVLKKMYAEDTRAGEDDPSIADTPWRTRCRDTGLTPNRIAEAIDGLTRNGFVEVRDDRAVLLGWKPPNAPSENICSPTDSYSSDLRDPRVAVEVV